MQGKARRCDGARHPHDGLALANPLGLVGIHDDVGLVAECGIYNSCLHFWYTPRLDLGATGFAGPSGLECLFAGYACTTG